MRAARFFFRGGKKHGAPFSYCLAQNTTLAQSLFFGVFSSFFPHTHTPKKRTNTSINFFLFCRAAFFLRVWLRFIFCCIPLFFVFFSRSTFFCAYFHTQYRRMLFSSLLLPSRFFLRKISARNLHGRAWMSVLELVVILCLQGALCKE